MVTKTQQREARQRINDLGVVRSASSIAAELEAHRQHRRWQGTKGCTKTKGSRNRRFCTAYNQLKAELGQAEASEAERKQLVVVTRKLQDIRQAGGVKAIDPQLQSLSQITGFKPSKIEFGFLVVVVIAAEFLSAFGIYLAVGHGEKPALQASPAPHNIAQQSTLKSASHAPHTIDVDAETLEVVDVEPAEKRMELLARYGVDRLEKAHGSEIAIRDMHPDFRVWCKANGEEALTQRELAETWADIAERVSAVEIVTQGRKKVVLNMQFQKRLVAA